MARDTPHPCYWTVAVAPVQYIGIRHTPTLFNGQVSLAQEGPEPYCQFGFRKEMGILGAGQRSKGERQMMVIQRKGSKDHLLLGP